MGEICQDLNILSRRKYPRPISGHRVDPRRLRKNHFREHGAYCSVAFSIVHWHRPDNYLRIALDLSGADELHQDADVFLIFRASSAIASGVTDEGAMDVASDSFKEFPSGPERLGIGVGLKLRCAHNVDVVRRDIGIVTK